MTVSISRWETWRLGPRDPLVFGDGGPVAAFTPRSTFLLPPQATAAGLVRSALLEAAGDVSAEAARAALGVRLRGPWLVEDDRESGRLWVPVPADVVFAGGEPIPPRLVQPIEDEGVIWPSAGPPCLVHLESRDEAGGGAKTERPEFPLWPLETVLDWGLSLVGLEGSGKRSVAPDLAKRWKPLVAEGRRPIEREPRIHVAIDPERQAALPEALFSSGGLRLAENFHLALEVTPPEDGPLADHRPTGLRVLGGESRTVACTVASGPLFPGSGVYEPCVREFAEAANGPLALRVELLTPGDFGGWRPRWPDGVEAPLLAVAMDRYPAVSGWDLQRRRPRAVRRLVPAGTVYYLGPYGRADALLETWRALWGVSLCEGAPGDPPTFLAPPAHDGYGLALPLPCILRDC